MPLSPIQRTALTTLLALVAAATIVTGAPVAQTVDGQPTLPWQEKW